MFVSVCESKLFVKCCEVFVMCLWSVYEVFASVCEVFVRFL